MCHAAKITQFYDNAIGKSCSVREIRWNNIFLVECSYQLPKERVLSLQEIIFKIVYKKKN